MTEKHLKQIISDNNIINKNEKGVLSVHSKAFDRWMASNIKTMSVQKLEELEVDEKKRIRMINPMINEKMILFNPPDSTKIQILTRLVETLVPAGIISKRNAKYVRKAVIERERLCSTAIMDGVAIPHPRSSMEKYLKEPALVLAISKRGIHFESDDGKPTNLFFFICANSIDVHLKVMARLSRLLKSPKFRHELIISEDFNTVQKVFSTWEKKL